jgi:cyclopropane fatty-acyl-phospholipid synthase-like methyltransferase
MTFMTAIPTLCARGSRILDLGTGSGRNAIFLARHGYEVHAIDASARTIAKLQASIAGQGLPIHAEVLDICSPAIDFSRYGAVLCTFVLHFLARRQAHELLDRARARAAPGAIHAIAAITTHGDFFAESSAKGLYYPAPHEISDSYRASEWRVHRGWGELLATFETHRDGTPKRNLVSFTVAGI